MLTTGYLRGMLTTGYASTAEYMRYFEPNARAARRGSDAVEPAYKRLGEMTREAAARLRR